MTFYCVLRVSNHHKSPSTSWHSSRKLIFLNTVFCTSKRRRSTHNIAVYSAHTTTLGVKLDFRVFHTSRTTTEWFLFWSLEIIIAIFATLFFRHYIILKWQYYYFNAPAAFIREYRAIPQYTHIYDIIIREYVNIYYLYCIYMNRFIIENKMSTKHDKLFCLQKFSCVKLISITRRVVSVGIRTRKLYTTYSFIHTCIIIIYLCKLKPKIMIGRKASFNYRFPVE